MGQDTHHVKCQSSPELTSCCPTISTTSSVILMSTGTLVFSGRDVPSTSILYLWRHTCVRNSTAGSDKPPKARTLDLASRFECQ